MKVWINRRTGGHTGGMIVVAANSAEEAHKTFHADSEYSTMWTKFSDGYISDEYYRPDEWRLMPQVEANVDIPQVLAEAGYTE